MSIEVQHANPRVIEHVVGQRQAVDLLKVALSAYWNDRAAGRTPSLGHSLFVGPPGTGKTTFAHILASELGAELKEYIGQTLGMGEDIHAALLSATDETVLFIDEAHLLSQFAQTLLLKACEERILQVPRGPLSKRYTSVPLSAFTLVLATTDEHGLLAPLRDRMKLTLRFAFYACEELAELCPRRAQALHWNASQMIQRMVRSMRSRRS